MQLLDLLILTIATWRLAYFIAKEAGPFGCMAALRQRFPLGGLTSCIYCVSIWAALALYLISQVFMPAVYVFAVAGGAMLAHRYTGGDHI